MRTINKAVKKMLGVILMASCILLSGIPAYAQYSGDAITETVYPGQNIVLWGVLGAGTDSYSWSTSALNIRYGSYDPATMDRKLDEYYATGATVSKLGGSIANAATAGGSYGSGDSKWYYQLGYMTGVNANLPNLANSSKFYMSYDAGSDTSRDLKDSEKEGYFDMMFAAKMNGMKQSANNQLFFAVSNAKRNTDFNEMCLVKFQVGDAGNVKIYPDKYEDLIYAERGDIAKLCPWYERYGADGQASINNNDARNLYNAYGQWSAYFNKDWVNNTWKSISGTNTQFMRSSITSYSGLRSSGVYNNFYVSGVLNDLIDTELEVWVDKRTRYNKKTEDTPYASLESKDIIVSTFQVSKDGQTWFNLCSNVNAKSFSFNQLDHSFKIAGNRYAMPAQCADGNSWYIRRISSATAAYWAYNNVTSPTMRIRPALSLDGLDVYYAGEGVTEGGYLDPKDVKVVAHYSTGDVVYAGNGSYITYTNTRIMNVGNNNYVYYKYVDPKLKEIREGWFKVQGKERKPVSMTAVYEGPDVVIEKSYNPANLRITVTYNNGDIGTFTGQSTTVGTLNSTSYYGVGDCDLTGAVNAADVAKLEEAIKGGNPFAADKKAFEQADVNGDGIINEQDVSALKQRVEGKIKKIGSNTFYATYSGLFDPKDPDKPLFATFYVNGINRSPYKLTIIKDPDRVSYIEGEDFDPKGMILAITYDNEEVQYINYDGTENTTGIKMGDDEHPSTSLLAGQGIMPIKYTENGKTVTANLRLTVRNKNLTSIKITQAADTLVYYAGENFNPTGMIVTAYYDEDVDDGKRVQSAVLESVEYVISDHRKLKNGQEYIVIKSDSADSTDDDLTKMNGFVRIAKTDVINGPGFEKGTSGSWTYNKGGNEKTVSGQIVGDTLVKVSFTERSITKCDYQPITVYPRKLASLTVQSMPFTTEYMSGSAFDSAGLILLATYTDGTSDYIYRKSPERNGYEITNGDGLTTDRTTVTASYTENEITKDVKIPITVVDPTIDGIEASYTGDSVYVGTDFETKDVIIVVSYTNGNKESLRANEVTADGSNKVKIVKPDEDGTINVTRPQDTRVAERGANTFAAIYAGHEALFTVNGIAPPDSLDFSGSIAENKRDYATWTEQFTAIKIKSVEDFVRGDTSSVGTVQSAEENHLVPVSKTTDTRTSLIQDQGTAAPIGTELVSPLLRFLRQGTWIQPETVISVQYKGRTDGYLFPEVNSSTFEKDNSYYVKYGQNKAAFSTADNKDGWSDWVDNGDSIGTVLSDRIAYNYGGTGGDTSSKQMVLGRMKFRLTNVPAGSDAYLVVEAESVNGAVTTYNFDKTDKDAETDKTVFNPARIKISLAGTVPVKNSYGGTDTVNFADVYKIFYRATTDDATKWAKGGEWTGYSGVPMQDFELRLMQVESFFDEGSASDRPVITENPRNQTVVIGYGTTLSVKAVGNDLTYQWYKNGTAISGATSNTYATPELTKDDDGSTYYCMVSSATAYTNSAVAMISVKDEYPALTQNIVNVEGSVGDNASLTVSAYCRIISELKFDWEITDANGEFKPFVTATRNDADGVSTIGFKLTSEMHGRRVRCKITNSVGSVYSNAVQINCSMDPVIELIYVTDHLTVSKAQTTVTATTRTAATGGIKSYIWTLNGSVQPNANTEKMSFVPTKEGTYVVTCKATDDFGSATETATFYVGKKPAVSLSYKKVDSDLFAGKKKITVTATVTASSLSNNVSLSWAKDGKNLAPEGDEIDISTDGKTLILDNISENDQFTVTCRVSDSYGDAGKIIAIS